MRRSLVQFLSKLTAKQCVLTLLFTIFVAELGVMFLLPFIIGNTNSPWLEAIIDSTLLTLFVTPAVWKIMIHPLQNTVSNEQKRLSTILKECADGIIVMTEKGVIEIGCNDYTTKPINRHKLIHLISSTVNTAHTATAKV